jgi:hypothetical protein
MDDGIERLAAEFLRQEILQPFCERKGLPLSVRVSRG